MGKIKLPKDDAQRQFNKSNFELFKEDYEEKEKLVRERLKKFKD